MITLIGYRLVKAKHFNNSSSAKVSCRFLLGGEEGRLKYAPPANFSPLFESLLPTQMLRIDPGFYMGDLGKAVLSGPLDIDDKIAFVPRPVDTSTVSVLRSSRMKQKHGC